MCLEVDSQKGVFDLFANVYDMIFKRKVFVLAVVLWEMG